MAAIRAVPLRIFAASQTAGSLLLQMEPLHSGANEVASDCKAPEVPTTFKLSTIVAMAT